MVGYIKFSNELEGWARDDDGRVLGDTRHVSQHMAPKKGIATVIIPPATPGGVPQSFDPHDVGNMTINYDPGRPEQRSVTVQSLRHQALQSLTTGNPIASRPLSVQEGNPAMPLGSIGPTSAVGPPIPDMQRVDLEALVAGRRSAQQPQQPVIQAPPSTAKSVLFQVAGFGKLTSQYSEVLRQGNMLILVVDHARNAGVCYFPDMTGQEGGPQPRIFVNVVGTADVWEIATTGIQFKHGTLEYCVLLIVSDPEAGE